MPRAARLIELAYLLNRETPIPLQNLVERTGKSERTKFHDLSDRGRAVRIRYAFLFGKTERWRGGSQGRDHEEER